MTAVADEWSPSTEPGLSADSIFFSPRPALPVASRQIFANAGEDDSVIVGKILEKAETGNVTIIWDSVLEEVLGDDSGVTGMRLKNRKDDTTQDIDLQGIFICKKEVNIGSCIQGKTEPEACIFPEFPDFLKHGKGVCMHQQIGWLAGHHAMAPLIEIICPEIYPASFEAI